MTDMFGFAHRKVSEEEVIDILLSSSGKRTSPHDYPLSLVLSSYFIEAIRVYSGIYFSKMVQRSELELKRVGKPGDFDILLIPYKGKDIYFEKTGVFEVKVVRPTIRNPSRNANSLGITQVNGLIEDGFPIVGLVHICITEPLPEEDCSIIKKFKQPAYTSIADAANDKNKKNFSNQDFDWIKVDWFSASASENQKRRLISFNLPTFVNLYSSSLFFGKNGGCGIIYDFSVEINDAVNFNPKTNDETIKKIENHFNNSPSRYSKVEFDNTQIGLIKN